MAKHVLTSCWRHLFRRAVVGFLLTPPFGTSNIYAQHVGEYLWQYNPL